MRKPRRLPLRKARQVSLFLCALIIFSGLFFPLLADAATKTQAREGDKPEPPAIFRLEDIPSYDGSPVFIVNENKPFFQEELPLSFRGESYAELDELGRCGIAMALVGKETMPTANRGQIGTVKPSGWQLVRYDDLIEDRYLYNRCHLIGFQLTGENDNERNLITGTRYMNVEGMEAYENRIADYVDSTGNHVFYRVTPAFAGDDLVAYGVLLEAKSVEDEKLEFNVFCYNVQPGIAIDYATGDSKVSNEATAYAKPASVLALEPENEVSEAKQEIVRQAPPAEEKAPTPEDATYIGNRNSKKFHYPTCRSVGSMKEKNKVFFYGEREEVIADGYQPCGNCKP